jgi:hypothetical protein
MGLDAHARSLATSLGLPDRTVRDAADAHIEQLHPGLKHRLEDSYALDLDQQLTQLLDLIDQAGSGDDFLGYLKFIGHED